MRVSCSALESLLCLQEGSPCRPINSFKLYLILLFYTLIIDYSLEYRLKWIGLRYTVHLDNLFLAKDLSDSGSAFHVRQELCSERSKNESLTRELQLLKERLHSLEKAQADVEISRFESTRLKAQIADLMQVSNYSNYIFLCLSVSYPFQRLSLITLIQTPSILTLCSLRMFTFTRKATGSAADTVARARGRCEAHARVDLRTRTHSAAPRRRAHR